MRNLVSCLIIFFLVSVAFAAGLEDAAPSKDYRCPVCGMYVSMFLDWNAKIKFADSPAAIFDGSKDMFKYYLEIKKYAPSKSKDEVTAVLVKDYYSKKDIDARQAYFVVWSDVYGPMGHEPIPFERKADAQEFLKEHKGKDILSFNDINVNVITSLDNPPN